MPATRNKKTNRTSVEVIHIIISRLKNDKPFRDIGKLEKLGRKVITLRLPQKGIRIEKLYKTNSNAAEKILLNADTGLVILNAKRNCKVRTKHYEECSEATSTVTKRRLSFGKNSTSQFTIQYYILR